MKWFFGKWSFGKIDRYFGFGEIIFQEKGHWGIWILKDVQVHHILLFKYLNEISF